MEMMQKICSVCSTPIYQNDKRHRIFCSKRCRIKAQNLRRAHQSAEYQRRRRMEIARIPGENKKKCAICGLWFVQVGSHIALTHKMTAREYRKYFDLPLKKGITAPSYRKIKGDMAIKNGTIKNLEKGRKYRYSRNDGRANATHIGWKGRKGKIGYTPTELYG